MKQRPFIVDLLVQVPFIHITVLMVAISIGASWYGLTHQPRFIDCQLNTATGNAPTIEAVGIAFDRHGVTQKQDLDSWERAGKPPLPYPFTITLTDTRYAGGCTFTYHVRSRADLLGLQGADFTYRGIHWWPVRFTER